ncbi:MAG: multiprotein bridging factor aMBF1 [Candidatus Parvarchaeota archaeon]|nr:multiprotein bridging factor aMBF1 [Candidatus Jingweiarchaeum tengchongense]MCW1298126.1 multiprotein bridging factor aMBF1 [Candidatus Jingweiarchaeum tengchongense]MCW1299925.1 multiprotein bridging factor aMBF1 [Candidatus Jingweiarchaeum tengchongense]MCW1305122.1 multiprotein bridging factor aMBF1 [Candidatus Jingweiarchaeum tengchongense]MCW1305547.1 multiprotein bridging factor aMBF1 [Candidatus Jingweiarchaeum tengchongense]
MVICELCGKEVEKTLDVSIEGSVLRLCESCSKFGKVIKENKIVPKKVEKEEEEKEITIVENYAEIFRELREKLGLTQEEFARKLNVKESEIKKIESSKLEPDINLALKIEKMFGVKLIEEGFNVLYNKREEKIGNLTIGDVIKLKKKKNFR